MELIFPALMILAIPISAIAVAIMLPTVIGAMALDMADTRSGSTSHPERLRTRMTVERNIARAFVVAGGGFWTIAAFAGLYSYRDSGLAAALMAAFVPLVAVAATLIVGWYFERVASALLAFASLGVVAWGVIYQFEMGVWILMTLTLIGPMATAATLFWLARRSQVAFELAISLNPEWATVPVRIDA